MQPKHMSLGADTLVELRDLLPKSWLKEPGRLRNLDGWVEITTPYLDRHNDCIQVYVRKDGEIYWITDDGNTIADLKHCGFFFDVKNERVQDYLAMAIKRVSIEFRNGSLVATASEETLSNRINNLVAAILNLNEWPLFKDPLKRF